MIVNNSIRIDPNAMLVNNTNLIGNQAFTTTFQPNHTTLFTHESLNKEAENTARIVEEASRNASTAARVASNNAEAAMRMIYTQRETPEQRITIDDLIEIARNYAPTHNYTYPFDISELLRIASQRYHSSIPETISRSERNRRERRFLSEIVSVMNSPRLTRVLTNLASQHRQGGKRKSRRVSRKRRITRRR